MLLSVGDLPLAIRPGEAFSQSDFCSGLESLVPSWRSVLQAFELIFGVGKQVNADRKTDALASMVRQSRAGKPLWVAEQLQGA